MKILQVNNVYAQQSTGKITKEIFDGLLKAGHQPFVAYGRGEDYVGEGIIRICPDWYGKLNSFLSRITGLAHGGCFLSTSRLINLIKKENPDIVHLQCINGHFVNIYRLISWLKNNRIKTVLSLHAEFMYTANCGYAYECDQWQKGCKSCPDKYRATKSWFFDGTGRSWRKMKKAFEGFENDCIICPVSPWTEERAKRSDILKDFKFKTVYNGVNTAEVFNRSDRDMCDKNTVLNVTSYFSADKSHIKGGYYIIELAKRMSNVNFIVAGNADEVADLPKNITPLGSVNDQKELAKLYCKAGLTLMVSRRETFSMPCAESLCCGTPVVGFKAGAPEQISLDDYSEFVEHGDIDALEKTVRKWLERTDLDRMEISKQATETYSVETMVKTFSDIYEGILWN